MTARWSELRETIQSATAEVGLGASEETIRHAEERLGQFPEDYRSFLSEFGWMSVGPFEFFGLGADVPPYLNVFEVTISERNDSPGFPDSLVVLRNSGGGDFFCYDSRNSPNDPPIQLWSHDSPDQLEFESATFADWLQQYLSRA